MLSRANQYLQKIVKSFLGLVLTENYNPQNSFVPFKNNLADFLHTKSSITVRVKSTKLS